MKQLFRYLVVGLASNLAGYLAYLLLTWLFLGPKAATSVVYVVGAATGFLGNRRWTFASRGKLNPTLVRFGIAHLCGYVLNVAILYAFVDRLGYPHQAVQAAAIVVVAGFLFATFRTFVFVETAGGKVERRLGEK